MGGRTGGPERDQAAVGSISAKPSFRATSASRWSRVTSSRDGATAVGGDERRAELKSVRRPQRMHAQKPDRALAHDSEGSISVQASAKSLSRTAARSARLSVRGRPHVRDATARKRIRSACPTRPIMCGVALDKRHHASRSLPLRRGAARSPKRPRISSPLAPLRDETSSTDAPAFRVAASRDERRRKRPWRAGRARPSRTSRASLPSSPPVVACSRRFKTRDGPAPIGDHHRRTVLEPVDQRAQIVLRFSDAGSSPSG